MDTHRKNSDRQEGDRDRSRGQKACPVLSIPPLHCPALALPVLVCCYGDVQHTSICPYFYPCLCLNPRLCLYLRHCSCHCLCFCPYHYCLLLLLPPLVLSCLVLLCPVLPLPPLPYPALHCLALPCSALSLPCVALLCPALPGLALPVLVCCYGDVQHTSMFPYFLLLPLLLPPVPAPTLSLPPALYPCHYLCPLSLPSTST
jgi:hypothetical protein